MYDKPLRHLLWSLVNVSFRRWDDVLIVCGGARREVPPHRVYIPGIRHTVTVVNITLNAYDYNAHSVLYHHRQDPLVKADAYFMLLDTVRVGKGFPGKYRYFTQRAVGSALIKPFGAASNLVAFGRGLVLRWRDTYDHNFTKLEAIMLEMGGEEYYARGARPMIFWARGHVTTLAVRVFTGRTEDPYHTGIGRPVLWYSCWDLYKYQSFDCHLGDITAGKLSNWCTR